MLNEMLMSLICLATFARLVWETGNLNMTIVDNDEEESEGETDKPRYGTVPPTLVKRVHGA